MPLAGPPNGSATPRKRGHRPRPPEEFWKSIAVPSVAALIVALVVGAAGAFIGAEYARSRPSVYQSAAVLLFDNPNTIAINPGSIVSISQDRAKYAGLIQTDLITVPASTISGVPAGVIASSVHATAAATNLNLVIVATAATPRLSQSISLGVAQAVVDYVANEQRPFPATLRLQVSLTSNPRLGARISPTHKKEITTGAAVGIATALVVYIIGQVVADQRRVRRRRSAELLSD